MKDKHCDKHENVITLAALAIVVEKPLSPAYRGGIMGVARDSASAHHTETNSLGQEKL